MTQAERGDVSTAAELARFALSGVANTALGYLTILALMYLFFAPPLLANLGGFATGLILSYFLNRFFTFRQREAAPHSTYRFVAVFLLCYGLNLAVLGIGLSVDGMPRYVAQLLAVGAYSISFFLLCRLFVFLAPAKAEANGS